MEVIFSGKNVEVTEALRSHLTEQLRKLEKYFNHLQTAEAVQSKQRNWHILEVTLHADGLIIRATERSSDMYASIDAVVEKLERQIRDYKERLIHRARAPATKRLPAAETTDTERAGERPRIVKTKRFAIKPMSPEEAALQMDLLGHDFFVFSNAETQQVNVLYRRHDNDYGLIEPAF